MCLEGKTCNHQELQTVTMQIHLKRGYLRVERLWGTLHKCSLLGNYFPRLSDEGTLKPPWPWSKGDRLQFELPVEMPPRSAGFSGHES